MILHHVLSVTDLESWYICRWSILYDLSVDDLSVDGLSADDLSVDDISGDDLSGDYLSVDDLHVDHLSVDDISVDDLPVDDISVDDLHVVKLSVDDQSVDYLICRWFFCRIYSYIYQYICKWSIYRWYIRRVKPSFRTKRLVNTRHVPLRATQPTKTIITRSLEKYTGSTGHLLVKINQDIRSWSSLELIRT